MAKSSYCVWWWELEQAPLWIELKNKRNRKWILLTRQRVQEYSSLKINICRFSRFKWICVMYMVDALLLMRSLNVHTFFTMVTSFSCSLSTILNGLCSVSFGSLSILSIAELTVLSPWSTPVSTSSNTWTLRVAVCSYAWVVSTSANKHKCI